MSKILIIPFLLISLSIISQEKIEFNFEIENSNNDLEINQLRYYVSSISLVKDGKIMYTENDGYHLIDHQLIESTSFSIETTENLNYDKIIFNIGVDSAKNMQGIHGGDLDPTKGMYWTWQSGYINFKLEAELQKKELSYHIGGFMFPNNACRSVELLINGSTHKHTIEVSPKKLFQIIDYEEINHVMSPGSNANLIADQLPSLFSIK